MIEMMHFRLVDGADESAFLAADALLQTNFAYQQKGLVRRTTARSDSGDWVVVDLWTSHDAADACAGRWDGDPIVHQFMAFVDTSTVRTARYDDIGG